MILINMDMPENCNKCPFHDWEYYVCLTPGNGNQDENVMPYNTTRHPKCPLMDFDKFVEESAKRVFEAFPFAKRDYFKNIKKG